MVVVGHQPLLQKTLLYGKKLLQYTASMMLPSIYCTYIYICIYIYIYIYPRFEIILIWHKKKTLLDKADDNSWFH